jgi:hypothetical protein
MESLRRNKIKYIKDNIIDIEDDIVIKLYENTVKYVPNKTKKKSCRIDMMKYIESNIGYIETEKLNELIDIIESAISAEDTDDAIKSRVVLEILNKILVRINHKRIKNITDFVNIRRDLLLTDDIKILIENNKDYIYKNGFNKDNYKSIQSNIKYRHFSILKRMVKEIGYDIKAINKTKYIEKERVIFTEYSIIKSD